MKMNKNDMDVILFCKKNNVNTQREIAKKLKLSLGLVNSIINNLINLNYMDRNFILLDNAEKLIESNKPKSAIILAAGSGTRMVPINFDMPKALLNIRGENIIERDIKFLHEVGIYDINVVVGFQKEKFEYLIDKYGVNLIVNTRYNDSNNIYSLYLCNYCLSNSYIIPSDIWFENNPFDIFEIYSWYMISDNKVLNSNLKFKKNGSLSICNNDYGNRIIGLSYINSSDSVIVGNKLNACITLSKNLNEFWEYILYENSNFLFLGKLIDDGSVFEIDSYNDLRKLDSFSDNLNNNAIKIIKDVFNIKDDDIVNIAPLKKGMTNRSFMFNVFDNKYIMRIPGEGTDKLINRYEEFCVYKKIEGQSICDDIVYIDENDGYKITKYIPNSRTCDPYDNEDLIKCMKFLKGFHDKKIKVDHEFDIFKQITFYEKLWNNNESYFKDYIDVKNNIFKLKSIIEKEKIEKCLTHIDAVPDNFLIFKNNKNIEEIRLIDFEYSGMQDPYVDIAMFCIYSMYDKEHVDNLIDIYFENRCSKNIRIRIYCYIACCGLLWSNWCEYKRILGVEFGEYSIAQYRYAKEYYKIVMSMLKGEENE